MALVCVEGCERGKTMGKEGCVCVCTRVCKTVWGKWADTWKGGNVCVRGEVGPQAGGVGMG